MSDTTEDVEGVNVAAVTEWFATHAPAAEPPLSFSLITGGRSNLTYRVTDTAGRRWVLRRPPLGQVLATAHDMGREHAIISALGPTRVPVPPTVGLCSDDSVIGAPFYVMDFVDGTVIRDPAAAEALDPAARRRATTALADTLAEIHAVDPVEVGLGELGRTEGYIARQLKRWHGQFHQSATRELPRVDEVHDELAARIPPQGPATIVHGDYRLDNCLLRPDGEVASVLDWEICTLGDPMADVGLLLVYWSQADDEFSALPGGATTMEGFGTRAELMARYAERSGRDLADVDYYVAFGYWKLACILEGVYARYAGGSMGSSGDDHQQFATLVEMLAEAAHASLEEHR